MTTPLVNLTVPVLNEEAQSAESVGKLRTFLKNHARFMREIVIADKGSTDRTAQIAGELSGRWLEVRAAHLSLKGRRRALKRVWRESPADIFSYMDVDLSTDRVAGSPRDDSPEGHPGPTPGLRVIARKSEAAKASGVFRRAGGQRPRH
jgi:hypothetical protein